MTTVQALTTEAGETIKFRQFEIVDTGHIDTRRYKGVTEGGEPVELNCYCDSKGWEEYWKVGNRRFVEYSYDGGYFEGKPLPKKVVREYGIA